MQEYYKRSLYGSRSVLARAVDFIILRAMLFIIFFLWFSTRMGASALSYLLSAILVLLFSIAAAMFESIRMDACKRRVNARLVQEIIRERILLMTPGDFSAMVHSYCRANREAYGDDCMVCPLQRSEKLNRDTMLCVYRAARRRGYKTVALFSPAPVSEEAESLIKRDDIVIIPQGDAVFSAMAEMNKLTPDEAAVRARILSQVREKREERKKSANPFIIGRVRRYWLGSAVLLTASFFVEYTLYYRLMAAVCATFASLSFWLEHSAHAQRS